MPDFSGRTDRELLDTLAAVQADPASYVPTAADEARRILEQRHPGLSLPAITAAVETREQQLDQRRDWIEARASELLKSRFQPSTPSPDAEAAELAVRSAMRTVRFEIFRESLLTLAIPALFVLGFIEATDPSSLWLAPFQVLRKFPVLKVIGFLPWAMARFIEFVFAVVPPGTALLAIAGLALLLVLGACVTLVRHVRKLRGLRALLDAPPTTHG